jgi:hypothetical protein
MANRSFFDQETQVRNSGTYVDNRAPTEAAFETNATDLEYDLGSVRSMLHELRDIRNSNWWAALIAPTTFTGEGGVARGVQNVNNDLHDLERKRILRRRAVIGADIVVPAAAKAAGVLTFGANATDGKIVTIGTKVYTFEDSLTNVDGHVQIGADAEASLDNLIAAILLSTPIGARYAAATTLHPTVVAVAGTGDTMNATAKAYGTAGNNIASTTNVTSGSWGAAKLAGGAGDVAILDASGELPGNLVAAVNDVATRGTVVASVAGAFGVASLVEVGGPNNIQPKNLSLLVNTTSGDPIVDATGREVYGLFQSEIATDGHTINLTTQRVQLSFVVRNVTYDDLELIDPLAMGGKSIDYAPAERYAFDDIPETSWLGDDFVDVGSGSTTRQAVYDNQGAVPVNLINHATLDLEGAGLIWSIRDDAEADLFLVTEGSGASNSAVAFGAAVDLFDNNAISNLFAGPLVVNDGAGGTDIQIGTVAGQINTTGTDDLEVQAGGELYLDDGNRTGSGWATDGIKLSESTTEWDAFKAEFTEVSLLAAILSAKQTTERATIYANVTGEISANTLITGAAGSPNISVQMPSYKGLTYITDVETYINGQRQRPGASSSADNDVYPSTNTTEQAAGAFFCEYALKYRGAAAKADNICMVVWGQATP